MKVKSIPICTRKVPIPIKDIRKGVLFTLANGGSRNLCLRVEKGYVILGEENHAAGNFVPNDLLIQYEWKGIPVEQTNEIEYRAI